MRYNLANTEILHWAEAYEGEKFHALLCDPPYELGFMGKGWDNSGVAFQSETWAALSAHLLPGGFGMAFASSRGWHRMAVAIEDAGLIIHPSIFGWGFGSGFPKATRIDSQIDKAATVDCPDCRDGCPRCNGSGKVSAYDVREVVKAKWAGRRIEGSGPNYGDNTYSNYEIGDTTTTPTTPLAQAFEGHRYGRQALKPALEPLIVFQKPYQGKPVDSIVATGAGALNIDGGRIGTEKITTNGRRNGTGNSLEWSKYTSPDGFTGETKQGRWPANLTLTHHPACNGVCVEDCPVRRLGEQSGVSSSKENYRGLQHSGRHGGLADIGGNIKEGTNSLRGHSDQGTAARYFFNADWSLEVAEQLAQADPVQYCAKASRGERDAGLEGFELRFKPTMGNGIGKREHNPNDSRSYNRNPHPTVKPIALAQHFATLLLPPDLYAPRRILVPFSGSGSEMIGALLAGWEFVQGIDMTPEYVEIAHARIDHWSVGQAETDNKEIKRVRPDKNNVQLGLW